MSAVRQKPRRGVNPRPPINCPYVSNRGCYALPSPLQGESVFALQMLKYNAIKRKEMNVDEWGRDMQESTVTAKGQTTLPKDVRAALHLQPGDKVRYLLLDGEVRILRARSVGELEGALKRSGQKPVTLGEMEAAITAGATDQAE